MVTWTLPRSVRSLVTVSILRFRISAQILHCNHERSADSLWAQPGFVLDDYWIRRCRGGARCVPRRRKDYLYWISRGILFRNKSAKATTWAEFRNADSKKIGSLACRRLLKDSRTFNTFKVDNRIYAISNISQDRVLLREMQDQGNQFSSGYNVEHLLTVLIITRAVLDSNNLLYAIWQTQHSRFYRQENLVSAFLVRLEGSLSGLARRSLPGRGEIDACESSASTRQDLIVLPEEGNSPNKRDTRWGER